jgi:hypothetical protein
MEAPSAVPGAGAYAPPRVGGSVAAPSGGIRYGGAVAAPGGVRYGGTVAAPGVRYGGGPAPRAVPGRSSAARPSSAHRR